MKVPPAPLCTIRCCSAIASAGSTGSTLTTTVPSGTSSPAVRPKPLPEVRIWIIVASNGMPPWTNCTSHVHGLSFFFVTLTVPVPIASSALLIAAVVAL